MIEYDRERHEYIVEVDGKKRRISVTVQMFDIAKRYARRALRNKTRRVKSLYGAVTVRDITDSEVT
jgi:hypothetical protein